MKTCVALRLFLLLLLAESVATERRLIHIQALWRHGDRTPIATYPTDPHQQDAWPVPWGELTTKGMWQQYKQGRKIKEEYIDAVKLLNSNYSLHEIHVRSSDTTRSLLSAYSNMAGFYSDSKGTHPDEAQWPAAWTPIPVHSVKKENDHLIYAFPDCPRLKELQRKQREHKGYIDFISVNKDFFAMIQQKAQLNVTNFSQAYIFANTLTIEKLYNYTIPEWVTDDIYDKAMQIAKESFDFMFGGAGFGKEEELELARLTGGVMISEIIDNIQNTINGKSKYRYHAYSGHDTTLAAFLRTLGAKEAIFGNGMAEYAATFIVELWELSGESYAIRLRYSANAEAPFETVTHEIVGCPASEFCPLETFIENRQKYVVKDILEKCAAKES